MKIIKLDGIKNVRDFGETIVKNGKIKECKLIRGTSLDKLTKSDIDILVKEYKLSTVIDLRTDREKNERPNIKIPNVKYIDMPIFNNSFPGITHENQEEFERDYREYNVDLNKLYRGIMTGEYLEKISEVIKTIIHMQDKDYSVYFHCTEGKDRTGIIAAILLSILGADKKTIINDYLYTNKVNKKKANKYYWKIRIFKHNIEKAERIKNIFLAKQEYIESAFSEIEENWGNMDNFILNGLNISNEEIKMFKDKILSL